jgi:phosphohistidine phosphatase SixA
MTDPGTTRRRPQLAPVLAPLLAMLVAGVTVFALSLWARTTVVVLVRHAEPGTAATGDADLSPAGEARAGQLGPFLEDALVGRALDYLYSADLRRSQQTAASVANQFKVPINLVGSGDWSRLASRILRDHRGATVAVVGGTTQLQGLLRRLNGEALPFDDSDYSVVLVVTRPSLGAPRLLRLHYGAAPEPVLGPDESLSN